MLSLLALGGSIPAILIYIIVIVGCIGICFVVIKASGISVPSWVYQILWIVLLVVVAVLAIRFLMSL